MGITLNNPPGPAAVTVGAGSILDTATILGVTGTLAAVEGTVSDIGNVAGKLTKLSGCNLHSLKLAGTCYSQDVATELNLSNNRMENGVPNVPGPPGVGIQGTGLVYLFQQVAAGIAAGAGDSNSMCDVRGNAIPNAEVAAYLYALAYILSHTVYIEDHETIHATAVGAVVAQDYVYDTRGRWVGVTDSSAWIYAEGIGAEAVWKITDNEGVSIWESANPDGRYAGIAGTYEQEGETDVIVTVA